MFILAPIILDGFFILISIPLPLKHITFSTIIILDLVTSIVLAIVYPFRFRHKINWKTLVVSIPFYFIGIDLLGLEPASLILKLLNLLKVFGLFFAIEELSASVIGFC